MSVKDTACNGHVAYIKIRIYFVGTGSFTSAPRSASSICGAGLTSWSTYYTDNTHSIRGAAVVVGDSLNGESWGNYVDNPTI